MTIPTKLSIEISPGELIDRLTIVEIRLQRVEEPSKRFNIAVEYEITVAALAPITINEDVTSLWTKLRVVNERLWQVEDDIRDCERRSDFGPSFIALARAVYTFNDQRSALKRAINQALGSRLVEEKCYRSCAGGELPVGA